MTTAPRTENIERLSVRSGVPPLSEALSARAQQLQKFAETLHTISEQWPSARAVALRWDPHRHVLATDEALATYRAIYGNDLVRGLRYVWASARQRLSTEPIGSSREPIHIDAPLPPDAIVIPQRSYPKGIPYVLTVVSAHEQRVVKIFSHERKSRFESELNAWRLAHVAGICHRVPEVIASGESVDGSFWLITRLVRNSGIRPPLIGDCLWRRYLLRQILPDLQRFYDQSGVEVLTGDVWLERARADLPAHPLAAPLQKLAESVDAARQRASESRIPFALVHGDLRPHNVHRYAGQWWLIDWSMSRRAPVMIDLWPNPLKAFLTAGFSSWLRGQGTQDSLTCGVRELDLYTKWLRSWLGITLDADSLRFHVLATLLHRLSYSKWPERKLTSSTLKAVLIKNSDFEPRS
jgi:hypothetical protein